MTTCPNCGRPCRGTCGICCVTRSREQMREQGRKWRKRNPEQAKKIVHDHYQRHKARKLDLAKKWRKDNPEKSNAIQRRWRKNNPELFAAQRERARVAEILRGAAEAKKSPAKPSPAVSRLVEKAKAKACDKEAKYGILRIGQQEVR